MENCQYLGKNPGHTPATALPPPPPLPTDPQ